MENLYKNFCKKIFELNTKFPEIKNFIIAYSTGPDSTFLLNFFKKFSEESNLNNELNKINIIAAHVFHDWGSLNNNFLEDQIERRDFAVEFCKKNNIKLEIFHGNLNDFLKIGNGSLEATGRAMRKFYFDYLLEKYENSIVVLGHTEDEQVETFFIKLARGSSLSGLCCMKIYENKIFRPLLETKKSQILNFLKENNIEFCIDESNFDDSFLRARIRNYIIPALKKTDSRFEKNIIETIENLNDSKNFLEEKINEKINKEEYILIPEFKNFSDFLKREIILRKIYETSFSNEKISKSLINEIIRFINNEKSNLHKISNLEIKKIKGKIYFKIVDKN